jgi:hypothetical protein
LVELAIAVGDSGEPRTDGRDPKAERVMGLIDDLARQDCERLTSRDGCLGPSGYEDSERCSPCKARAELSIPRSQRTCTNCHAVMVEAITWDDNRAFGTDIDGSGHCPAPRHSPHLYYNEFTKRGGA